MKLYTFLDENDKVIEQVRAENHDQAIAITGLDWNTDFYSETLEEEADRCLACDEIVTDPTQPCKGVSAEKFWA